MDIGEQAFLPIDVPQSEKLSRTVTALIEVGRERDNLLMVNFQDKRRLDELNKIIDKKNEKIGELGKKLSMLSQVGFERDSLRQASIRDQEHLAELIKSIAKKNEIINEINEANVILRKRDLEVLFERDNLIEEKNNEIQEERLRFKEMLRKLRNREREIIVLREALHKSHVKLPEALHKSYVKLT
jgi:hypothetical protein